MINIEEVNGEIARLENQPTTMVTVEKLAALYTVRDHLTISPSVSVIGNEIPQGESEARKRSKALGTQVVLSEERQRVRRCG